MRPISRFTLGVLFLCTESFYCHCMCACCVRACVSSWPHRLSRELLTHLGAEQAISKLWSRWKVAVGESSVSDSYPSSVNVLVKGIIKLRWCELDYKGCWGKGEKESCYLWYMCFSWQGERAEGFYNFTWEQGKKKGSARVCPMRIIYMRDLCEMDFSCNLIQSLGSFQWYPGKYCKPKGHWL